MSKILKVCAIVLLFTHLFNAPAFAADMTIAPNDLKSFQSKINNSLVQLHCGNMYSVGFAGDYNISQEMKDKGQNSLILTTATGVEGCKFGQKSVEMTYRGSTSTESVRFYNGKSPDFASVITSVNIQTLSLFSDALPQSGWWVGVVRNVPGFGLNWESSRVRLVNAQTLNFTIDEVSPGVKDNALVFSSDGQFIGMLSSFQAPNIDKQLTVQGAPLQCQFSKANSAPTVTICEKLASEIWSKSTNSSTTTALPAEQEVIDTSNATLDAINRVDDTFKECQSIIEGIHERFSGFELSVRVVSSCSSIFDAYTTLNKSRAQVATLGLDINGKVNAYNRVTDQALAKLDQAEMIVANLQDLGDYLNPIADALDLIDEQISTIRQKIEDLNGRIAGLPLSLQISIKKNAQYKLLDSKIGRIDSVSEFIQGKVPQIKTASTTAQLQIVQDSLNQLSKTLFIGEKADKALATINKLIPNYVCTKGSSVVLLSKTGKCLTGYKKITTDL